MKLQYVITTLEVVCILIFVVGSYIYTWNEPYNSLKIPWPFYVCLAVGVVCYIYEWKRQ